MRVTRRQTLRTLAGFGAAAAFRKIFPQQASSTRQPRFTATRASLQSYTQPEWFADAKFGIWSHWGPQSAIGNGDWYARDMYVEDSPQYQYHVKRFGPQSKIGYKDLIPLYTAERWDPEHLMDLYQRAGAKYFFSMGVHHDNFDLWNSKHQPLWNAVASGPRKDIVGLWAAAARRRGLRFGVSEHLSNSFDWFAPAHLADTKGSLVGVPYDGQDPAFAALYHDYSAEPADYARKFIANNHLGMSRESPDWWKQQYLDRIRDLIDQHQPDLLYTDGGIPFEEIGLACVAELYNVGPVNRNGDSEAIYFSKTSPDCVDGRSCTLDHERSVLDTISPFPWQTDTCIGSWHYKVGQKYKTPKKVIDMLVDIVSKNGNLLLNFPLPASGELDSEELTVLEIITAWMHVNGEGIYGTRPWTIYGEGPATQVTVPSTGKEFNPNEGKKPDLTAADIRFTTCGKTLFAFIQGWPAGSAVISSLATNSSPKPDKVIDVRILGRDEALRFTQGKTGLRVTLPAEKPATADIGITLKIRFG